MKFQRGMGLSGLMIGGVIFALLALLTMKVLPEWIEYGKIVKVVKATANDGNLKDASIADVRAAYDKRADIDLIKSVSGQDLDITKESNNLNITFAYTKKVPLFYNVSLVFDFEGHSASK
jgi:hypothetical protein